MRLHSLMAALVMTAACGGGSQKPSTTSTTPQTEPKPLYDRIGGVDGIKGVVKDFVEERVAKDWRISARFSKVNVPQLEQQLTDQLCAVTGGPCKYTGKTMKEAHAGMAIGDAELAAFLDDFGATLNKFNVPAAEQKELLAVLAAMHDDIVEKN